MMGMNVLFCSHPLYPGQVDPSYEEEWRAAVELGLECELISFERLVRDGDAVGAVRRVKAREKEELAFYRGWMLRPLAYERLYEALRERGVVLVNTPEAYRHCHYLPESYRVIEGRTPETVWLPLPDGLAPSMERVIELLKPFGDKPLVLKDYVKSRKHEWEEACFIPCASDSAAVERVVRRFLELQGEELSEGLVFREFVALQSIGSHSQSGMPLTKEFRWFFLDSQVLHFSQYWSEGNYSGELPLAQEFESVISKVQSRFFTMDVAQRTDGSWVIVELGDGQVAGLAHGGDATNFYKELLHRGARL